ncbi:MAG: AI-2E family transporter [candidate division WOR-3 bacterium]|nr:MAG: AI-2E family transporter [candidate division WOR-3 bacterium]
MQNVVLYLSFIIIGAFVILSKTFSPIWLLLIVMAMLWPQRKKNIVRPVYLMSILLLLMSLLFAYFTILVPFIIGIGLAYILAPIVDILENKRVPKILAILACLIPIIALLPLLIFFIISGLVNEMQGLIKIIPSVIQQGQLYFRAGIEKLMELGMDIDPNILTNTITNQLNSILSGIFGTISQIGKGIGSIIIIIYNIIIIPLSAYLLLSDRKRIMDWFRNLFPTAERKQIDGFIEKLNFSLARFFRGQIVLMALVGFIVGFSLWILGIRYYLLLGLIAGICNLIPNIGYILSFIPAILIGITSANPLVNLIKIVSVYVSEQVVENLYLGPVIIGRASRLHPLVVMVALIIGGTTFGIWGVVLAIPVTIFVREFMNHFLSYNL